MKVIFEKTDKRAQMPQYQTTGSSGFDFHCVEDEVVCGGETKLIKTGLKVQLPKNTELQVRSRSGLALKQNYMIKNSPGTVDEDYRGEIGIIIFNPANYDKDNSLIFKRGDRVAQGVIVPILRPKIVEGCTDETSRGNGGFGSTDSKTNLNCADDCLMVKNCVLRQLDGGVDDSFASVCIEFRGGQRNGI